MLDLRDRACYIQTCSNLRACSLPKTIAIWLGLKLLDNYQNVLKYSIQRNRNRMVLKQYINYISFSPNKHVLCYQQCLQHGTKELSRTRASHLSAMSQALNLTIIQCFMAIFLTGCDFTHTLDDIRIRTMPVL